MSLDGFQTDYRIVSIHKGQLPFTDEINFINLKIVVRHSSVELGSLLTDKSCSDC